jgi:VIT1/CCC1 family predicted Fe2+/Mn2+ transporter
MNKNPIDDKFDKVSNVISTSKTVFQFLNLIWYLLLLVGFAYIIGGIIYCLNHGWEPDGVYAPPAGLGITIVALLLVRVTTSKIKSIK